ncbi:CapA family protein [Oscillatoria acuminata]|uniref:Bacterial capsule synthesis protein PGA_cap n=1 Tax=Oscillatoria acuminata PCC 6304 TaxID=56110 RepID=K9TF21_9CYAN|nr:CapA family protein [Oscillatoria acuminata]AFY81462.1 Bacterial capsule synthesis protein PGA_cap [Oscillatoria acuminata PCC 6304]
MDAQNIVNLAKQGDPAAIAVLLNQALRIRNMTAQVVRHDNRLHILLEADRIPDRQAYLAYIQDGLTRLNVPSIHSVRVYARQIGQKVPAWDEAFEFGKVTISPLTTPSVAPEKPASKPVATPEYLPIATDKPQISPNPSLTPLETSAQTPRQSINPESDRPLEHPVIPQPAIAEIDTPPIRKTVPSKTSRAIGHTLKIVLPTLGIISLVLGTGWDFFRNGEKFHPAVLLSSASETLATVKLPNPPQFPSFAARSNSLQPLQADNILSNFQQLSELVESSIPNRPIIIKAVGDIIPGVDFPTNKLHPQPEQLFQGVTPYLQGADLVFGNFESTLTNHPYSAKDVSRPNIFAFRTPPSYTRLLKEAGFNILSVANNHSLDFTDQGFEDTIKNIEAAGMVAASRKGEIAYTTVNDIPIAFIGFSTYSYHNSILDLDTAKALVEEAQENATLVVISFHGGAEGTGAIHVKNRTETFFGENRGNLVEFSRAMIDVGADLVLGHGPHVPRALEVYKGKLIAYSLGNFMGYRSFSTVAELGYSLILEAELDLEGNFIAGQIIPIHLNGQGIPSYDSQNRTVKLMQKLTQSDFPETALSIEADGKIVKVDAQ